MKFADLHCHVHMRTMYWLYYRRHKNSGRKLYNPWTVVVDNSRSRKRARRASGFIQSDMVKNWNGKVRLNFNSLYPLERGFVLVAPFANHTRGKSLFEHFVSLIADEDFIFRDVAQALYMNLPRKMINFFQSEEYNYFSFLREEFEFVTSWEGKPMKSQLFFKNLPRQIFTRERQLKRKYKEYYYASGIYRIPKNREELIKILDSQEETIIMPLTIEGAHSLGSTDFIQGDESYDSDGFRERIRTLKTWSYPIFFITFAHHFFNGLCGHAQSFPKPSDKLLDQLHGVNTGLLPQGEKAIRQLLSITDDNQDNFAKDGYRILIDVKHMAAKARRDFYDKIIIPRLKDNNPIPLIASHCGYSGAKTLNEMIHAADTLQEKNDYFLPKENPRFYGWNINMCDEDIRLVFETEGLFGISFDQRILGVPSKKRAQNGRNDIDVIYDNLVEILNVIYLSDVEEQEKIKVWDRIAIGTDFEGYINPVDPYPTNIEFEDFRTHLIEKIINEKDKANAPKCFRDFGPGFTVEMAVDKLCYGNALAFLRKWYPEKAMLNTATS